MTPEPNRARTSEPPLALPLDVISSQIPLPTPICCLSGYSSSSGEEDDAVKVNVLSAIQPVMAEVICYLSEQKQTTVIGLTIIPAK